MFSNYIIANCLQNVPVKEFWKAINIWQKYSQSQSGTFFRNTVYFCSSFKSMGQNYHRQQWTSSML